MLIITREMVLQEAGISIKREARRSHKAIKEAHKAKGKDGQPDHPTRLKAADLNLRLLDAYPKPATVAVDASRPVNVVFVLATDGANAADLVQADEYTLSLGSGAGDRA